MGQSNWFWTKKQKFELGRHLIYLWRKVVCFVVIRSTELGCFRLCSLSLWKALDEKGCMGLVPWRLDLQCQKSWILNDFFATKYFQGIGMCLWCCWKDFDEQDLMEFIWQDLDSKCGRYWFWVISPAENSNKFQKTRFSLEGKISWEHGNTWRLTIQFKNDFLSYLAVQKIHTYIAKQCSHVEFPYFVMGSHLGQQHRPH